MTATTKAESRDGPIELTDKILDAWVDSLDGPVALHLKQKLVPVEGEDGVIFPPTYADIGYNIDTLADGTKVATIDSVGSQANRIEPIFKATTDGQQENPLAKLVPQIDIKVSEALSVSIFDIGHRLGDALVRSSALAPRAKEAFEEFLKGSATKLAKLAPTSIVFGAWDSRDTSAKLPRIVQSVIRAWDVRELTRSAQYNPPVDYATLDVFSETEKAKAEGNTKSPLAQRGFVHVPSGRAPGGIIAGGPVVRDVTINLIALRRLPASEQPRELRQYILGLSLVAATHPMDGFLRQGCLLTPDPSSPSEWVFVERDGKRTKANLDAKRSLEYAAVKAKAFVVGKSDSVQFDKAGAKNDLSDSKKGKGKKGAKEAEGGDSASA
jgi:CRISPR-associated protein Csb1